MGRRWITWEIFGVLEKVLKKKVRLWENSDEQKESRIV
jgi:hypothetical protein